MKALAMKSLNRMWLILKMATKWTNFPCKLPASYQVENCKNHNLGYELTVLQMWKAFTYPAYLEAGKKGEILCQRCNMLNQYISGSK